MIFKSKETRKRIAEIKEKMISGEDWGVRGFPAIELYELDPKGSQKFLKERALKETHLEGRKLIIDTITDINFIRELALKDEDQKVRDFARDIYLHPGKMHSSGLKRALLTISKRF